MSKITCKNWINAAINRAIRTVAQAALGAIGTTAVFYEVDWKLIGGTALLAGIISILTSLSGLPECKEEVVVETVETVESEVE